MTFGFDFQFEFKSLLMLFELTNTGVCVQGLILESSFRICENVSQSIAY